MGEDRQEMPLAAFCSFHISFPSYCNLAQARKYFTSTIHMSLRLVKYFMIVISLFVVPLHYLCNHIPEILPFFVFRKI